MGITQTKRSNTGVPQRAVSLEYLRRPGFGARPHRTRRALAVCRDYVQQENPDLDPARIEVEAQALLDDLNRTHPLALEQFERTAPTSRSPKRKGLQEKVEIAAMRALRQGRQLEALLCSGNQGRPSNPALPLAIFECNAWAKGAPEVRRHYNDFLGSDALLDWTYGHPLGITDKATAAKAPSTRR